MRVLFFDQYAVVDGIKSHIFTAGREMLKRGHEVAVALMQPPHVGANHQAEWIGFPLERVWHTPSQESFDRLCAELLPGVVDMQHPGVVPRVPTVLTLHTPRFITMHSGSWGSYDLRGLLCVDDLTLGVVREQFPEIPATLVRNAIDLERFQFHEEPGEGVCFVGRVFDELLSVPAREQAWCEIDFYGNHPASAEYHRDGHRFYPARATEGVLPRYRVVIAASQCAIEAMAMGRLVANAGGGWAPGSEREGNRKLGWDGLITPENIAELMTWNYRGALGAPYEAGRARAELEGALAMPEDERLAITRANREWVEREHDARVNTARLVAFYEGAAA